MDGKFKICFVCYGNICRSPMAEFVMKKLVGESPLAYRVDVTSRAAHDDQIGNDMYPPAKEKLTEKRVPFTEHRATQFTLADYRDNDIIIAMDRNNLRDLRRLTGDKGKKIKLLMEYLGENRDVADPWYTGDFEATYMDVLAGCSKLVELIMSE